MMEQLERFVQIQYGFAHNATTPDGVEPFFHNAFGAVQWEMFRTGEDLTEWWEDWREKFLDLQDRLC